MTRGIYTAATGMQAEEAAQQVIAQNLANASTTGYKQQIPGFQSFQETMVSLAGDGGSSQIGTLGHGAALEKTFTDLSDGSLQQTGNSLDIALRGNAYLAVKTPDGPEYSRDGSLTLNAQGTLVQASTGLPVLDDVNRPIALPASGSVSISPTGDISVNGKTLATLGLYGIDQTNIPSKIGDNLISVVNQPKKLDPTAGQAGYVQAGFLEASNVNVVKQMVTMLACLRTYEANAKAMQSQDDMQNKAINQVGLVA